MQEGVNKCLYGEYAFSFWWNKEKKIVRGLNSASIKNDVKYSGVHLTRFQGAEWGRFEAALSHAGFPREAATFIPDAAHPWSSLQAHLLCQEGLAAGRSVNKHVVEQHTGEAPKDIHGPEKEQKKELQKEQTDKHD